MVNSSRHSYIAASENEAAEQMSQVSDPRAKLRSLVWGMIDGVSSLSEYIPIMLDFWAIGLRTEEFGDRKKVYQSFISMIVEILEDGIQKQVFRKVDSQSLASALIGLFDGLVFQMISSGPDYPVRKSVDVLIDNFLHGIELKS